GDGRRLPRKRRSRRWGKENRYWGCFHPVTPRNRPSPAATVDFVRHPRRFFGPAGDFFSPRGEKEATSRMNQRNRNRNIGDRGLRDEAGLFLEKAEVGFVALVLDLLAEVLELALPGIMLLLRLPRVASLVVQPSPPPRTPRDRFPLTSSPSLSSSIWAWLRERQMEL
ncbi:hypothetical protein BHE74_00018275, partial [Ensete ventricosum]